MAENKKKSGVLSQIIVGVVILLTAGGTAPWWLEKLFPPERSTIKDHQAATPKQLPGPQNKVQERTTESKRMPSSPSQQAQLKPSSLAASHVQPPQESERPYDGAGSSSGLVENSGGDRIRWSVRPSAYMEGMRFHIPIGDTATTLVLQTDTDIYRATFRIYCSADLVNAYVRISDDALGQLFSPTESQNIERTVFTFKLGTTGVKHFSPESPLIVTLVSKSALSIKRIERLTEK